MGCNRAEIFQRRDRFAQAIFALIARDTDLDAFRLVVAAPPCLLWTCLTAELATIITKECSFPTPVC